MIIKGTYSSKGASEVILDCDNGEKYVITRADALRLGFLELNDEDFPLEFEDEALIELLSQKLKAIHYCTYLLGFSDKSEKVLRQKLKEKEYSQEAIDKALEVLKDSGITDDTSLCLKKYISIANSKLYGPVRIKNELFAKGFSYEDIKRAEQNADIDFKEKLSELCQRLLGNKRAMLCDRASFEKFKAKLVRYGYGFSDINSVLSRYKNTDFDDDY